MSSHNNNHPDSESKPSSNSGARNSTGSSSVNSGVNPHSGNSGKSYNTSNSAHANNAVDSSFRKIVKRLFIIVGITMVTVGAYLYFNFTAPSNLPVIVPADATFFVQFQTRKIRDELKSPPQAELDSLVKTVANLSALNWIKNPADVGIALFSDVVYFQTEQYQALALTLNSEPRFRVFLDSMKKKGYVSGLVEKEAYSYTDIKMPGWENVYIGFKHKAVVILQFHPQQKITARSIDELFRIPSIETRVKSNASAADIAANISAEQTSPETQERNSDRNSIQLKSSPSNLSTRITSPEKVKNSSIETANIDEIQAVLAKIFTGDGNGFVKNEQVQKLYDEEALILMTDGKDVAKGWGIEANQSPEILKNALQFAAYQLNILNSQGFAKP